MLYVFYLINNVLHLWLDDAHVGLMEQGLLSPWRDAHGVICDYLSFFLWNLHGVICAHSYGISMNLMLLVQLCSECIPFYFDMG